MSFRARLTLVAAAAVALAVVLASIVVWLVVRNQMLGQFDKGLALMERGIARGIKDENRPQDAKLHLGVAYFMAGRKDKALEIFPTVTGIHGAADMGRLWALRARQPQERPAA